MGRSACVGMFSKETATGLNPWNLIRDDFIAVSDQLVAKMDFVADSLFFSRAVAFVEVGLPITLRSV